MWWLPDYDEMLRQLIDEYQWAWRSEVLTELESRVPETVLRGWREGDPQCREYHGRFKIVLGSGASRSRLV